MGDAFLNYFDALFRRAICVSVHCSHWEQCIQRSFPPDLKPTRQLSTCNQWAGIPYRQHFRMIKWVRIPVQIDISIEEPLLLALVGFGCLLLFTRKIHIIDLLCRLIYPGLCITIHIFNYMTQDILCHVVKYMNRKVHEAMRAVINYAEK